MHPNVYSSIIYNCQDMDGSNLSVHQQMNEGTSLAVQWLGLRLPMQGMWV